MKTLLLFILSGFITSAVNPPADTPVKGAWQLVKSKYGDEKEYVENEKAGARAIKMFTGTRWSGSSYNLKEKKISGTNGGTYKISGTTYTETVEYFSWDASVEGKTFVFTMTLEQDMLHQVGYIEYNGNAKYLIDEWFKRID